MSNKLSDLHERASPDIYVESDYREAQTQSLINWMQWDNNKCVPQRPQRQCWANGINNYTHICPGSESTTFHINND